MLFLLNRKLKTIKLYIIFYDNENWNYSENNDSNFVSTFINIITLNLRLNKFINKRKQHNLPQRL